QLHELWLFLENPLEALVGILPTLEFDRLDRRIGLQFLLQGVTGMLVATRVGSADVPGEVDGYLDVLEVIRLHLVDGAHHEEPTAEHAEGNRGGQDHRDGHGDVSAKTSENLTEDEAGTHLRSFPLDIAGNPVMRNSADGHQRPTPYTPRLSSRITLPLCSSTTRLRMESTIEWSCVAMTTVVPVRLIRSSNNMMS